MRKERSLSHKCKNRHCSYCPEDDNIQSGRKFSTDSVFKPTYSDILDERMRRNNLKNSFKNVRKNLDNELAEFNVEFQNDLTVLIR